MTLLVFISGSLFSAFCLYLHHILRRSHPAKESITTTEVVSQLEQKKNELSELVKHLHQSSAEIQKQNRKLEQLANHDPLTGSLNRRSFFDQFHSVWQVAVRYKMPISTLMVDIDNFKSINDRHGHSVGDDVLQAVTTTLQSSLRASDILCRYGGEEFAVVLPNTKIEQAGVVAELLRSSIASLQLPNVRVTASLGISSISESPADPQEMLDQADKCLYIAKRQGRNRAVRWDQVSREMRLQFDDSRHDDSPDARHLSAQQIATNPYKVAIPYHAVSALVSALAYRDYKTAAHSRRVADLCVIAAEGLLSLSDSYTLEMAALLHDIGKIGVPDTILLKPDRLTEQEWEIMNRNTRIGSEIVRSSFGSAALTNLVRGYQMRFDDPAATNANGRCMIPVGARILAIADAYDSMTSENHYRSGMSASAAIIEIRKNAGRQFDPCLVERFIQAVAARDCSPDMKRTAPSSEAALSIGVQMEGLVAALDSQNLQDISVLASRIHSTASEFSAVELSTKAHELESQLQADDDFLGAVQTALELLDLCRSTQSALLQRPDYIDLTPQGFETVRSDSRITL